MSRPPFHQISASRAPFDPDLPAVVTQSPNPAFKPGGGIDSLPEADEFVHGEWRSIDPAEHAGMSLYKFLVSAVTPRPIAFVSSLSADGAHNLAPFSYFNLVGHDPPMLMVSFSSQQAGLKDTPRNIKETDGFCVSIISEPFIEAANYTSIDAPLGTDEWALAGLTKRASEVVKAPHPAEAGISFECTLEHWYDMKTDDGHVGGTVVLGRIRRIHAKEFIFDPDDPMKVLAEKLRPVSRLGGITFGRSTQFYEAQRPRWEQVKDTPEVKAALGSGSRL